MATATRPAPKRPRERGRTSTASLPTRIVDGLVAESTRFWVLVSFAILVAFTGGGSRADIQSLIVLRPLSVLYALYGLLLFSRQELRTVRTPLFLVLSFMGIALVQLVPLPPNFWTSLPRRDLVSQLSAALGLDDIYRPISLDPDQTWNTFFALFVPLAAILLTAIQSPRYLRWLVPLLVCVGFVSTGFAILQLLGQRDAYLYEITNMGRPVGLFSNRNHQAVMLAWLIPGMVWAAAQLGQELTKVGRTSLAAFVCLFVLLLFLIVLTGSRAGMLLTVPATLMAAWLVTHLSSWLHRFSRVGSRAIRYVKLAAAAVAVGFLGLVVAVFTSGRNTALSRLVEDGPAEDLRFRVFPILQEMAVTFFPSGAGFGAFEDVFKTYETREMLSTRYLNQAHNDLFQFIIEGGLPALVLLVGAIAWLIATALRIWRSSTPNRREVVVFYCGSISLWLAASLVDYPLRTPLAAMLVAILTGVLAKFSYAAGRAQMARHAD